MLAKYWAPRPTARMPRSLRANDAGIGPASTGSAFAGKSDGRRTTASGLLGAFAASAAPEATPTRSTTSTSARLIGPNDSRASAGPAGADEGVDRRGLTRLERDGSAHGLRPLHLQAAELRDDVVRREEDGRVARSAVAVRQVRRVVADHDERPARRERGGGRPEHAGELGVRELQVQHGDEVERLP